jgi:hypothetical protein
MDESDVTEGMEVTHPFSGRGYVAEHRPNFGEEPDEVTVWFYQGEEETVPVYTVQPADEVTTAGVSRGTYGFEALVDDGHCSVIVRPDGTGEGYEVEVHSENGREDSASLHVSSGP